MIEPEQKKLNMGCGFKKLEGFWNVDNDSFTNPDQQWDLEITPWPWETDFFEKIMVDNVLEHLGNTPNNFLDIIKQMYRVTMPDGEWMISLPHHRSDTYFDDFGHVRILTPKTFKLFDQKFNESTIKDKFSDSVYGLSNGIDIEVINVDYDIIQYWRNLLDATLLGNAEFEIKLNTLANVAQNVNILCKVHKPCRVRNIL